MTARIADALASASGIGAVSERREQQLQCKNDMSAWQEWYQMSEAKKRDAQATQQHVKQEKDECATDHGRQQQTHEITQQQTESRTTDGMLLTAHDAEALQHQHICVDTQVEYKCVGTKCVK